MDFDDKLKLLKKERSSRTRTESISKTWQRIEKNAELSTKEKLEKLISLTRGEHKKKEEAAKVEPLPRKPLQLFESSFSSNSRYGRIPLSAGLRLRGEILSLLSRDPAFEDLDLTTALFLDLETTGLSGGTGTVPFLVGLGFYRDGSFQVLQFFLGDMAEEESLVQELSRLFSLMNFRSVVSFNGKSFDLPLLETRFILHRSAFPLSDLPHLDFLFSARSLWRHKHESCRLFHLAHEVLEAERGEDIPSAEIPTRYFQFLRSGDFSLIEPVLYHNQEDILSLLGVVIVGASLFAADAEGIEIVGDAMDLFGAANLLEKKGEVHKSADYFRRALDGRLSEEAMLLAKTKLARYFKRNEQWDKALSLWKEMAPYNQLSCYRELAMFYEHKEKDYEKAREFSEQGLALALDISSLYRDDFVHRLERLKIKIDRKGKGPGKK